MKFVILQHKNMFSKFFYVFLSIGLISGCSNESSPRPEVKETITEIRTNARFQLINSPMTVIDTHTGQVWSVERSPSGVYRFVQICYLASDGKSLMPTPFEESFVEDLTRFKKMCTLK